MTKKSWDDIDISGLSMDTGTDSAENSYSGRPERLSAKELAQIALDHSMSMEVRIQNLTSQKESSGIVLDVSTGGIKFLSAAECRVSDMLRLSFSLSTRRILCRAKVSWSKKEEEGYLTGVQFIAPDEMDVAFIKSLPVALRLKG